MNAQFQGKYALVTGGNKGIGFAICHSLAEQGITVLLGARDERKGNEAVSKLQLAGLEVEFVRLDLTDEAIINDAARSIEQQYGKLDILVNNAAVNFEFSAGRPAPSQIPLETLRRTFEANFFGTVAVTQAMLPLIRNSESGRIVNISSAMASLTLHSDPNYELYNVKQLAYNASKTALNAFTVHLAYELKATNIKVNSADPGWVKTDMGGDDAHLTPEEAAETPIWLATLPDDGPTGGFFSKKQPLPW